MEGFIYYLIVGIAICGVLITLWNDRQERKRMENETNETPPTETAQSSNDEDNADVTRTRGLFLETLAKIGCQYHIDTESDGRNDFAYQEEYFSAYAPDDSVYIHIWDMYWKQVELGNLDDVCCLRRAINTSNIHARVTTMFTINEADGKMDVHCKSTIPFLPSMPVIENYLRNELNVFFRAHQIVEVEMQKQRETIASE